MTGTTLYSPIEVLSITAIEQLADCLPYRHRYFTLLLAWDAPDFDLQKTATLFRQLVDHGLVYFCAWGTDCEFVHDAVDSCAFEKSHEQGGTDCPLMTTWHAGESLEEALWFFKTLAIPTDNRLKESLDRFVVSVGDPHRAHEIEQALSQNGA